jgi:hypothetical protein
MATPSASAGAAGAATNGEHHHHQQQQQQQQQAMLTDTLQAAFRGGESAGWLAFACLLAFLLVAFSFFFSFGLLFGGDAALDVAAATAEAAILYSWQRHGEEANNPAKSRMRMMMILARRAREPFDKSIMERGNERG